MAVPTTITITNFNWIKINQPYEEYHPKNRNKMKTGSHGNQHLFCKVLKTLRKEKQKRLGQMNSNERNL